MCEWISSYMFRPKAAKRRCLISSHQFYVLSSSHWLTELAGQTPLHTVTEIPTPLRVAEWQYIIAIVIAKQNKTKQGDFTTVNAKPSCNRADCLLPLLPTTPLWITSKAPWALGERKKKKALSSQDTILNPCKSLQQKTYTVYVITQSYTDLYGNRLTS